MNTAGAMLKARSCNISGNYSVFLRCLSTQAKLEELQIPKRINRGPTDILRALESTIKKDLTAPHYKYHDDPYLIPMSNIGKRTFALAQESGKKTAHWVRSQHPQLFQHKECDPPIEMFFPKMVYNEKSEVTEEDLKKTISNVLVSDAVIVYKLLKDHGISISAETQQSFLDLLCFYNHEDTLPEEFIEERWYKQGMGKEKVRKTWKDGQLAEELFISLENPTAEVYSSLIQGMTKYYQVDRAWQLFEEAQSKGFVLNVNAYNAIIRVASFLKESYDMRWSFVKDILGAMSVAKVQPNLGTLNAVLQAGSTMGTGRINRQNMLSVLKEFQMLGIEPSLATWYFILITFCKERGPVSYILRDILPHLENKEFHIRDVKDTYFFATAMDICRNHIHDREMAVRVNNLLHFGNNYDLIGDSFKESIYHRHYFSLMCESMPLDEFMSEIYENLVPHIYVPEPTVMGDILRQVELNAAIDYLPKLWSDMTIFDQTDRENLLNIMINTMMTNKPPVGSNLYESFATIAWGVWSKIANQNENRIQKLTFTGEMLGNLMTIVLWNDDFEKASIIMNKLDKDIHSVVGVPQIDALSLYIDHCIKEKSPSNAIKCIQYCSDCGFPEGETLALKVKNALTLDEFLQASLNKIIGESVVPKRETKSRNSKPSKQKDIES